MGAGRKTTTVTAQEKYHDSWKVNASAAARNLSKLELGAIIFGCKHSTIKECLEKEIFGLPAGHYPYVKKATPGLTLFLFNYSDRKLHGIYEAVSSGGMNISPNAWITSGEGAETTPYPAQVRIRTRCRCRPLFEEEIKPIIANNYYEDKHFWFELDKEQTKGLMTLFQSSPWPENMRSPSNADWMKNKFNGPSKSTAIKTAGKELKDVDSKEHCGMARARRKENEHSNASVVSNVSAYPPGKKWSELFKASSSSSVENNAEVLECQEALNPSTECIEVNSNAWSGLPPEACNGAVNDESDSDVVECWEDSDLVDDYVKEIFENSVQNQNEYSGNPDLNIPSAENTTFLDGWGDLKPSESDFGQTEERREDFIDSNANNESDITSTPVLDCERHGNQPSAENTTFVDGWGDLIPSKSDIGKIEERREDFIYSKANNESDIISAPVGDCERDGNQLNFIETRVQRENGSLSEGVLMDVESSNFLYAITKFMQEIEELKAVQFNQCLRTQTLEHELVHSKQEIDELKKRCQKLEGL